MNKPFLHIFETPGQLAADMVRQITLIAAAARSERNRFTIALSGGSVMRILASALKIPSAAKLIDWQAWHVFWADERCVPVTSPDNNFGAAFEQLFRHVAVPHNQLFHADATLDPAAAAIASETMLAQVFQPERGAIPRFDLIVLGIGPDGHTASLFPGHSALDETLRWVVPVFNAPKPPPTRLTMTLPLINNARHVFFAAYGAEKSAILSQVLSNETAHAGLPAHRIRPASGTLHWFIDRFAARKIAHGRIL